MQRFFANLVCLLLLAAPVTFAGEQQVVRMATTTSTENSGLFKVIQPALEQALDIKVHIIAVGTGKALELGRRGDVDVVLVHAKPAEEAFVAAGYGVARHEIMYNDFIIVGPQDDPAGVRGMQDADSAFAKIAATGALFVSRGDDSGTHKKELATWQQAGIEPAGDWYRQVGQGMGKTLQIAGEMQAYALVDRGTWLAYRANTPLKLLVAGGTGLKNSYGIIAVSPERFPDVNYPAVERLIHWFQSGVAHDLIAGYRVGGEQLFYPVSNAGSSGLSNDTL
ncbi:MAG: substrate-binding domain-containing protein [Gammaproteobacteria bacterium]|nr:substrate-binding domain-containing protein [Gammaproteobacteria bacterium]